MEAVNAAAWQVDVVVKDSVDPYITLASAIDAGLSRIAGRNAICGPSLWVFIDDERRPARCE
jgi:hypothetical protein